MSLNVSLFFADDTTLEAGTPMQLLRNGSLLASAPMGANGSVTFDTDPVSSQGLSVRVDTGVSQPLSRGERFGAGRNADVVLVIDSSASMAASGYVTNTVIDGKAFVSYSLPGDDIGVVSFATSATLDYKITPVDASFDQNNDAAEAIEKIAFNGGSTCIGCGIQTAYDQLALGSAANPKAAVLFTDGYHNSGLDPLQVPPTYPVFACAMGPDSDHALIQKIAERTDGVYYYMPYPFDMMRIFNQIRAKQSDAQLALNYTGSLTPASSYLLLPVTVSGGRCTNQIGVVWNDASRTYTPNDPKAGEVCVKVYNPEGLALTRPPSILGAGYLVFDLPNPEEGTWNVYVEATPGTASSLADSPSLIATASAFEVAASAAEAIVLHVDAPALARAGQPFEVTAHVTDGGEAVEDLQLTAEVVQPAISVAHALEKHKEELARVKLPERRAAGGAQTDRIRLQALRAASLPDRDILPHRSHGAVMRRLNGERHALDLGETSEAGSYNVTVSVTGYSKKSERRFQRTQLVTVLVQ